MKLKDINLENIKNFIEGNSRLLIEKYGGLWLHVSEIVKEQVEYRVSMCKPCLENGSCLTCGCATPGNFYASKGCRKGSYPPLLSDEYWQEFKKNLVDGNYEANVKFYMVWECEVDTCKAINAFPYKQCYKCNKTYKDEEVQDMIKKYQDVNIHNQK